MRKRKCVHIFRTRGKDGEGSTGSSSLTRVFMHAQTFAHREDSTGPVCSPSFCLGGFLYFSLGALRETIWGRMKSTDGGSGRLQQDCWAEGRGGGCEN